MMITLSERSNLAMQELIPLVAGLGMGLLFRSPFVAVEAAMYDQHRASCTGNFFLVRFIGACTGLVNRNTFFHLFITV
jgi:hypothetical protein